MACWKARVASEEEQRSRTKTAPAPGWRSSSWASRVQSCRGGVGMQIRLTRDLEDRGRAAPGSMTVDTFLSRFPEVPRELRDEPVVGEFVRAFGTQLQVAQKPSPCVARADGGDAEHIFYTRLVNDLAIYGIGLARRDRTLQRLERLLTEYRAQPATFACTLVPRKAPGAPRAGCAAQT